MNLFPTPAIRTSRHRQEAAATARQARRWGPWVALLFMIAQPPSSSRAQAALPPGSKPTTIQETTPPASDPERTVAEIAKATRPSLVKITQDGREGAFGIGSGFVISSEGLIATNRHVIGEGRSISVETSDGQVLDVIEVLASDSKLDLAILKVNRSGLKPLELADSDAAIQGQPIVAMGNPQGLTFSVTDGVISEPRREVEGFPMIQVAVPIEQGNSGGPLLDRNGRVLGVLTLKSALTENLGFAMPSNALRRLLEKPNPVPIERWLTFGVLNRRLWQPLLGARWTQRAGLINVSRPGSGFGGRSLCLWTQPPPADPFEVSVSVWMDNESGAAGLAFCSDGQDRHYGFYPSNGNLRLTRFDGPDVLSWHILAERECEAYRPSNWNALRVRVENDRIQCFVNDVEVFDLRDAEIRGGQVGLCKFRSTGASFKHFKTGVNLASSPASRELEVASQKTIEEFLSGDLGEAEALQSLRPSASLAREMLESRRKKLEEQASKLRDFSQDLHHKSITEDLHQELSKPDEESNLLRCALLLAKHDNPELDIESYQKDFERMAEELCSAPEIHQDLENSIDRINRYLFLENGFHGSRQDFGNRSNSYLNEVLDDREGLPITLSILYLELARQIGVREVVGLPLPGRFMVGYRARPEDPYSVVDVYDQGKKLTLQEAINSVSDTGEVPERATQAASKRDILVRMIRNLMGALSDPRAVSREQLPYLDLLIRLDPDSTRERVARAMLRERLGQREGAIQDIQSVLESGHASINDEQAQMLQRWLRRLGR
jgi:serine protease Do